MSIETQSAAGMHTCGAGQRRWLDELGVQVYGRMRTVQEQPAPSFPPEQAGVAPLPVHCALVLKPILNTVREPRR